MKLLVIIIVLFIAILGIVLVLGVIPSDSGSTLDGDDALFDDGDNVINNGGNDGVQENDDLSDDGSYVGDENVGVDGNEEEESPVAPQLHTVEISSSDFSLETLNIKVGDIVTWVNLDSGEHWPAGDVHPTHREYPGSDIDKCGTADELGIFDSCRGLEEGESWPFIFNDVGEWDYHDHLNPGLRGTIIVE